MILLACDTSGPMGSLALLEADGRVRETSWIKKAMHSEVATVQLQSLLQEAGISLINLTHMAVNCGPGSFTGLRVGISMVKTLAYSLSLPVAPINTLEALAFTHGLVGEKIFVATKAVQNFYYVAAFEKLAQSLNCSMQPRSADGNELQELARGCTKVLIEGQTPGFQSQSSAKVLIDLLQHAHPPRHFLSWKDVEPLYIRGSEAEEKLKKGLLGPSVS